MNRHGRLGRLLDECSRVALDTSAVIYFLQGDRERAGVVAEILRRADAGGLVAVVPAIVQMELLVRAMKTGNESDTDVVFDFTERTQGVTVAPIRRATIIVGAEIRANTGLKAPDALVAGSALVERCDVVIGNDRQMERINSMALPAALAGAQPVSQTRFVRLDTMME